MSSDSPMTSMNSNDPDNETQENNSIASDVLTNVQVVLVKIFKLLNARQLNACARVCRLWRSQVKWEKESRKKLRWNYFTYGDECDRDDWKNTVQNYIEDSPFDPTCILMFCTTTLWAQVVEQTPGKKRKKRNTMSPRELILPCIPSKCVFQLIVTDGIIGTDAENKTKEMEDYSCAVSLLMIGCFPGIEFASFSISHVEWADLAKFWNSNSVKKPACMKPLANKDVKMFNLFCPMNGIDQEVCYALFKMFGWPLVAGGFVNERSLRDSQGVFHSTHHSCIISGLALCGAEVQVASVVLRCHIQMEDEVNRVIRNLTDYNFPAEKSFGLMYACVGRGQHLYNKQNVEANIFRKYFPKTPLLGFFGNGEIGCTFPQPGLMPVTKTPKPDPKVVKGEDELTPAQLKRHLAEMREKLNEYRNSHVPKILHSYTTVICLVALP